MNQDKKEFILYLVIAFVVAWILQIAGILLGDAGYQLLLILCMFAPFLAVLIVKKGLGTRKTGIGWKPHFRKNWKAILIIWFLPIVLSATGAVFYFGLNPEKFDTSFGYLMTAYAGYIDADGTVQGLQISRLAAINMVQAVTYAPFINMFFALGEEVGWRGYMTPLLEKWLGRKKAWLASGVFWGLWHAPLIVFAGYEYGLGYWGAPFTGVLMMCVFTTSAGILCSYFYNKTETIWAPALLHGGINGVAAIPLMFTDGISTNYILGPTMAGLVAGIPLIILAAVLWMGRKNSKM